jgi:hypothetical protein
MLILLQLLVKRSQLRIKNFLGTDEAAIYVARPVGAGLSVWLNYALFGLSGLTSAAMLNALQTSSDKYYEPLNHKLW